MIIILIFSIFSCRNTFISYNNCKKTRGELAKFYESQYNYYIYERDQNFIKALSDYKENKIKKFNLLTLALLEGNVDKIKNLIKENKDFDTNEIDGYNNRFLDYLAYIGNYEIFSEVIDLIKDLSNKSNPFLHILVSKIDNIEDRKKILEFILKKDENLLNEKDEIGHNVLMIAAIYDNVELFKEIYGKDNTLIKEETRLQIHEEKYQSINVLGYIAIYNSFKIIKYLNDIYPILNESLVFTDEKNTFSFSELAIKNDQNNKFKNFQKQLKKKGIEAIELDNIDTKIENGKNMLTQAVHDNKKIIVESLLDNGADIEIRENDDWSIVVIAAYHNHVEMLELIIKRLEAIGKKDFINSKTKDGSTALIEGAHYASLEAVKLLLNNGADINQKKNGGYTALMFAAMKGHKEVVELLIQKGANVNARTDCGETALSSTIIVYYNPNALDIHRAEDTEHNIQEKRLSIIFSIIKRMKDYYTNLESTNLFQYKLAKVRLHSAERFNFDPDIKKEYLNLIKEIMKYVKRYECDQESVNLIETIPTDLIGEIAEHFKFNKNR